MNTNNFWGESEPATEYSADVTPTLIPDNTQCLAMASNIEYKQGFEQGSPEKMVFTWEIIQGEYAGLNVRQNCEVYCENPDKRARAVQALATIDAICGSGLLAKRREPSDSDLLLMTNKKVVINVREWEMDGKQGNWVDGWRAPKQSAPVQQRQPAPAQAVRPSQNLAPAAVPPGYTTEPVVEDFDQDIAF